MLKKVLLFATCIWNLACQSVEKISETDQNGLKVEYSIDTKTKMKEGLFKRYFENGQLMEEATYLKDVLNGERKIFSPEGNLLSVENYQNGSYEGKFIAYAVDGHVEQEGQYTNNEMSGEWKTYYPGGQLKESVTFANNLENGPFKEYFPNGILKTEGNYKNGDREEGELREYQEDGTLLRIANCSIGRCTTTWRADTIPVPK